MSEFTKFENTFQELVIRFKNRSTKVSEKDGISKILLPLIEALGWNIYDFNEVREEVSGKRATADCVLYFNNSPIIVWEFKRLNTTIEFPDKTTPETIVESKLKGLDVSKELGAKYFVMSSFSQTVIWDVESGERIMGGLFSAINLNYKQDYKTLWNILSKQAVRMLKLHRCF